MIDDPDNACRPSESSLARPELTRVADPRPIMASDYPSAQSRELVYVTRGGQVISPVRARAPQLALVAAVAALVALGIPWWAMAPSLVLLAGRELLFRRGRRGVTLLLHGRLDEAERVLAPLASGRWTPRLSKVAACSSMSLLAAMRGDHAAALEWARRGLRHRRPRALLLRCRRAEVHALVNLDRVGEARSVFDRHLRAVPPGDLGRHAHWQTELYLALGEGHHQLDAEELHRRALEALRVTSARGLLALLAWAHDRVGDVDQSQHLLREALAREDVVVSERSLPRLAAWIDGHREAALAAESP